jgi:hypothetical protein
LFDKIATFKASAWHLGYPVFNAFMRFANQIANKIAIACSIIIFALRINLPLLKL